MTNSSFYKFAVSALIITSIILVNSCKGPAGPQGPAGIQGTTGAKGDTGPRGNANVTYSDWKTPNWDGTVSGIGLNNSNVYLSTASTTNSLLTKEAINSAAIYTYIKYYELVADPGNSQQYTLIERISLVNSVSSYFKIPGRSTNKREDFAVAVFSYDNYAENYFSPQLTIITSPYDYTKNAYVPIPEITNKAVTFYKDIVKSIPQYRQVVVFGNVKGGRYATIDWSDYHTIKELFQLKD